MNGAVLQPATSGCQPAAGGTQRIDKWLWHARFFKTRTRAARLCGAGRVRVNRRLITKPSHVLRPGDVLTFPQESRIRVVRVVALGRRRGPAGEAQTLYRDLSPPIPAAARVEDETASPGRRAAGSGRPTKAERRAMEALRSDRYSSP